VTDITSLVAVQAPYGGAITQSAPDGVAYEIRIGEREESPHTEFLRVVLRANRRRLCARTHHASLLQQLRVPPRSLQPCLRRTQGTPLLRGWRPLRINLCAGDDGTESQLSFPLRWRYCRSQRAGEREEPVSGVGRNQPVRLLCRQRTGCRCRQLHRFGRN